MRPLRLPHLTKPDARRGALTVEMALITPVLLALIFGVMQVGYAFMVQHALQDAARQGCRTAVLRTRSNAAVVTAIQSLLQQEGLSPSKTTTTILVNNITGNVAAAQAGDDICVKVSMPLADATLFPGFFSNFTGTMQGAVMLRCE